VINYRAIGREDADAVLELWAQALGEDRHDLERDGRRCGPGCLECTRVAVAADRTILAAGSFWIEERRDVAGRARRVGHLDLLATRPEARGRGYGGRVLEELVTAMRRAGCTWAMALPAGQATDFYKHRRWRAFSIPVCEGVPASEPSLRVGGYDVRRYDPLQESDGWAGLARVYDADSVRRPLALVRDIAYWEAHVVPRVLGQETWARPPGFFLVATKDESPVELCGYVLAHVCEMEEPATGWIEVSELCTRPGHERAAEPLLAAVVQRAAEGRGRLAWCRLFLPREPAVECAADQLLVDSHWGEFMTVLIRPIADELDEGRLDALLSDPRAVCWTLEL
jgi:GNAT superfamily N-acetyltransferase